METFHSLGNIFPTPWKILLQHIRIEEQTRNHGQQEEKEGIEKMHLLEDNKPKESRKI